MSDPISNVSEEMRCLLAQNMMVISEACRMVILSLMPAEYRDVDFPDYQPETAWAMAMFVKDMVLTGSEMLPHLLNLALFDGTMPEEFRADFCPGEFVVAHDGEIVYLPA